MNLEIQNLNFLLLFVAEENLLLLEILWHCFTVVMLPWYVAITMVTLFYGYYV